MSTLKSSPLTPAEIPFNSIYAESSTQEFALGTKLELADGRIFRYALNGAVALAAGYMCDAKGPVAHHTNIATGAIAAAGQNVVTISTTLSTTMVADEYAEGWFLVNDATGEGQMYQIESNSAGTTGTVTLKDNLVTALATTSEFTLVRNPYNAVVVSPTTQAAMPVGVPLIAVTASYYCWLQVHGMAPARVDAGDTVIVGDPVGRPATNGTAGGFGVLDASHATAVMYGRVMVVNAADEFAAVFLTLE